MRLIRYMNQNTQPLIVKYYNIVTAVSLILFLTILYYLPRNLLFGGGEGLCIFKRLTGFNCPGCGLTRGLYLLLHWQIRAALGYNPAVPFVILILVAEIIKTVMPASNVLKKAAGAFYYLFLTAASVNYLFVISNQFIYHHKF